MMVRLNIQNMKEFLNSVNDCNGAVYLLHPNGHKEDLHRHHRRQDRLLAQYRANKNYLPVTLQIEEPTDYFRIVSAYIGSC